jgi:translation initiation factor 1 (eIF-1/SUI1)
MLINPQFSPRHPNATKAMTNWEKKSAYLLKEIVKFSTYIEALSQAGALKEKIYAERAESEKLRKTVASELDDGEQEQQQAEQPLQKDIAAGGDLEEDEVATTDVNVLLQGQARRHSNGSAEEGRGLEMTNTAIATS